MTLIEYYKFREDLNEMNMLHEFDAKMDICGIFNRKSYSRKSCRRVQTLLSWGPFIKTPKDRMYWNFKSKTKLRGSMWDLVQASLRMRCRGHEKYKQLGRVILTLKRCGLTDKFLNTIIEYDINSRFFSEELIHNRPKMSGKEKEDMLKLLLFSNDHWSNCSLCETFRDIKWKLRRHHIDRFCRLLYAYYEKIQMEWQ